MTNEEIIKKLEEQIILIAKNRGSFGEGRALYYEGLIDGYQNTIKLIKGEVK